MWLSVLTGPRSDSPGSGGSDEVGRAGPRQAKFTEFTKGYVPKGCDGPSLTTDLYAVGQSIEDFLSDAAEMVCGSVLLLYRCRCMCTCVSRSAVGSRRTGVLVCAWLVCLCASDCCEVLYVGKFWLFCVVLVLCRIFTAAVCVTLSVCARDRSRVQGHYVADDSSEGWITRLRVLSKSLLTNDATVQADACRRYLAAVSDSRARAMQC